MAWSRYASTGSTAYDYTISQQHYNSPLHSNDTCPVVQIAHAIDDFVVYITPESEFFYSAATPLNVLIDLLIAGSILVLIFSILQSTLSYLNRQFNVLSFIQRFLLVVENEFLAARSFLIIIALLSTTLFLGGLSPMFSLKTPALTYLLISAVFTFLLMITLWPISLIYNWGSYFTIYIKGESTMGNLLGQVVMDYFYVISFFLRINLQFLRLITLSGVFIVYNEFYFEFIYPVYNFASINFSPVSWNDYAFIGFKTIISAILRFVYELGHMWVVLIMQANALAMILFLILQSLHTVYLAQKLQSYFKSKRN